MKIRIPDYFDRTWNAQFACLPFKKPPHKATDSVNVDDSFIQKAQALCDTLVEDVAFEIVKYTEKNKEVDTITLKRRALMKLDEARQQFRLLQRIVCL